jgi:hypothetical protein
MGHGSFSIAKRSAAKPRGGRDVSIDFEMSAKIKNQKQASSSKGKKKNAKRSTRARRGRAAVGGVENQTGGGEKPRKPARAAFMGGALEAF